MRANNRPLSTCYIQITCQITFYSPYLKDLQNKLISEINFSICILQNTNLSSVTMYFIFTMSHVLKISHCTKVLEFNWILSQLFVLWQSALIHQSMNARHPQQDNHKLSQKCCEDANEEKGKNTNLQYVRSSNTESREH